MSFNFGDGKILIDQDQQSVIVCDTGEVRIAFANEVPTPGFFFDENDFLKHEGGGHFYLCEAHEAYEAGIMGLRLGYQAGCLEVELYKSYVPF